MLGFSVCKEVKTEIEKLAGEDLTTIVRRGSLKTAKSFKGEEEAILDKAKQLSEYDQRRNQMHLDHRDN